MKTLLLLRHAKSSWDDPGLDDHDRPLNKRGKKAAPQMGKLVREEGLAPELILCSTALRTRATAEAVAQKCGYAGDIVYDDRLYMATPGAIVEVLRDRGDDSADRVMVVGHNPGQEELIRAITGREERLPTGALASIRLPVSSWKDLQISTKGELVRIWRPKEIS